MQKKNIFVALLTLTAILLLAVNPSIIAVKAQSQATINILASIGGSTDPPTGPATYNAGTSVTLTATADNGYAFQYWIISSPSGANIVFDNPASLTVSGGVTYSAQAVFQVLNAAYPPSVLTGTVTNVTSNQAVVILLPAIGGNTKPGPGTYTFTDATAFNISATPLSGWRFDHWVIGGYPLSHGAYSFTDTPTDNPYNVNHGYGYTYSYQPVFSPTTIPEFSPVGTAILAIILVVAAVGAGAFAIKKRGITRVSNIQI